LSLSLPTQRGQQQHEVNNNSKTHLAGKRLGLGVVLDLAVELGLEGGHAGLERGLLLLDAVQRRLHLLGVLDGAGAAVGADLLHDVRDLGDAQLERVEGALPAVGARIERLLELANEQKRA